MAGGDYHPVRSDPAVERWVQMHATMYERFRFTPQRARQTLLWGLTVPVLVYYLASATDDRWDLRAKTREDSLLRRPAVQPEEQEKEKK